MSSSSNGNHLELPSGVSQRLEEFRRHVRTVKLAEGCLAALFGLLLSWLAVFVLDRLFETPAAVRGGILIAGSVGLGLFLPLKWHRWVWRQRQLEHVARLLRHRFPRLSDQLLGVIELAHSDGDGSARLVQAAMEQVDEATRGRDFSTAVPNPRHRTWAWAAGIPLALGIAAMVVVPAAGWNSLARWLFPWSDTERYTFAKLDALPDEIVVPYAEPFPLNPSLAENTEWSPEEASARYGGQKRMNAALNAGKYDFSVPPQKEEGTLAVKVGDARKSVDVKPTTRPELESMIARVELPKYLQRDKEVTKDIRGGAVSLVMGSKAVFEATASRRLADGTVDGKAQTINNKTIVTKPVKVTATTRHKFSWKDSLGLTAKEPFTLKILARDDEAPSLACQKLNDGAILLEDEVLSFDLAVRDDFGIQTVGLEWLGLEDALTNPNPAKGEKIVSAGDPESTEVNAVATFNAKREGVKPQALQVRAWAIDYKPERERIYSPAYTLYVLSAEEHAMWITGQFKRWYRQAQEVHGRERQLYETNLELRKLDDADLDKTENRKQIQTQAANERANGRRLNALTDAGKKLVKQATRNDQFNVATLETWAEMLQTLEDIAGNRMPSVADLLKQSADAPAGRPGDGQPGQGKPGQNSGKPGDQKPGKGGKGGEGKGDPNKDKKKSGKGGGSGESKPNDAPKVGENRNQKGGGGKSPPQLPGKVPKVPSISDVESGFNPENKDDEKKDEEPQPPKTPRLTLPGTTLIGGPVPKGKKPEACPAGEKLDEAIDEQEDLLAEFARVADELAKILGNLEGSTFVKRLKAASRRQMEVAGDLNRGVKGSFGVDLSAVKDQDRERAKKVAEREIAQSESVYTIEQDLEAYYNRVHQVKFRTVFDDMRNLQVVTELKQIGDTAKNNLSGRSIAEAEFWADSLDRWAEQLVGPG